MHSNEAWEPRQEPAQAPGALLRRTPRKPGGRPNPSPNSLKRAARDTDPSLRADVLHALDDAAQQTLDRALGNDTPEPPATEPMNDLARTTCLSMPETFANASIPIADCPTELELGKRGVRARYCAIAPTIDVEDLRELSGLDVFRSGPHGDSLNLESTRDFGRYNRSSCAGRQRA